jgi:hypothetical protein
MPTTLSKLCMLIWDALGVEFRSRQEWYEMTTNGNQERCARIDWTGETWLQ